MSSIEAVLRFGFPVRTGGNEHAEQYFASLRAIVTDYAHQRDAARENPSLTDQGRRERVAEIANASVGKIAELEGLAENVSSRVQELQTRARSLEPRQPDDLIGEARAREIREALRAMPRDQREKTITRAVENGDETIFAAAIGDPLNNVSPLISEQMRPRLTAAWVGTKDPKLVDAIKSVSELHASMISTAESTRKNLQADAGVQPDLRERITA